MSRAADAWADGRRALDLVLRSADVMFMALPDRLLGHSCPPSQKLKSCALVLITLSFLTGCGPADTTASSSSAPAPEVAYGTKVSFGQGGNSAPMRVSGWSATEEKFTWTEGTSAVLKVKVPASDSAVTLKMTLAGLIKAPELPYQPVEVMVNNQKVADWQVANTAVFTAILPRELTKPGGELTILLKTPKATSPKTLEQSADARVLGVSCFDLELTTSG